MPRNKKRRTTIALIQGKAYWAKIVGAPKPGYDKTKKEWSIDVSLSDADVKMFKAEGIGKYVKNNDDERGNYVSFKRKAVKADGEPAQPIRIVDHKGQPWGKKLIGNGSTVNVKFAINDYTYNGKDGKKPSIIAVQVWDLVEYESKGGGDDDFPTREGEESWDEEETA